MPAGTQWYRPPSGSVLSAAPGSARTRGLSLLFPQGAKTSGISPRLPTIWLRPTTLYPCKKAMPDGIAPRKPATALMSVLTVVLSSAAVKHIQYILSYRPVQALEAAKRMEAVACLPRFRPGFSVSDYAYRIPELANSIPDCRFILSEWLLRFRKQSLSVKNLSLTFGPVYGIEKASESTRIDIAFHSGKDYNRLRF